MFSISDHPFRCQGDFADISQGFNTRGYVKVGAKD